MLRRKLNIALKQREGDPVCGEQLLEREPRGVLNTRLMGHLDLESQALVAPPDDHRGGAIPGTSIMDALAQLRVLALCSVLPLSLCRVYMIICAQIKINRSHCNINDSIGKYCIIILYITTFWQRDNNLNNNLFVHLQRALTLSLCDFRPFSE